jgi:CHAT domain-containing protein
VALPWAIAVLQDEFLSRTHLLSRQLEINAPGRPAVVRPAEGTLHVLVIGDPTGDLKAARREAEAVAARLEQLPGAEVTSLVHGVTYRDVSRELDTTRYDVLHYAGHARFDPEGHGRGGLVLADQILTPEDLSTRRYLPGVVFANACQSAETGVREDPFGGGEQTVDLVTGLLRAGVRGFVGSMWRVDDEAAMTFADSFYGTLSSTGQHDPRHRKPIGAAVADARRAVIDRHGEGEPAWAGYALYGSPWLAVP